MNRLNPHISVDCVIFGFDAKQLKVLLIEREQLPNEDKSIPSGLYKLPGNLISDTEDLDNSAYRILKELTGVDNIFLKQFSVFANPNRLNNPNDLIWLRDTSNLPVERVLTVAYYSLVKISSPTKSLLANSHWIPVKGMP